MSRRAACNSLHNARVAGQVQAFGQTHVETLAMKTGSEQRRRAATLNARKTRRAELQPDPPLIRLPVIQEELEVRKVPFVSGVVRIQKVVSQREQVVDPPLASSTVEVEHIPINRLIDTPAEVRQEGDVTIFPVMEEVVTVTTQLVLREEIRVRRRFSETHRPQQISVRREEVVIERVDHRSRAGQTGELREK